MRVFSLFCACTLCAGSSFAQQAAAPAAPAVAPASSVTTTTTTTTAPATAVAATTATAASGPTAPVSLGPDANGNYKLQEGEDVNLAFMDALSSKTASEGDPVNLQLVDDLKVNGVVVAKAGAPAVGEVTKAEKNGMMGKAGQLNIRLDYVKQGSNKIRLRGTKGKEGANGTTGAVVLTVLFGPLGLIHHGSNVEIKKGQAIHAFVSDDILLPPVA